MGRHGIRMRHAPRDEIGPSDDDLERCSCGVLFPVETEHRCKHVGDWITWERYQTRQKGGE